MKKNVVMLVLLISIKANLFAQKNNAERIFEIPANTITRTYFIDLDKGDKIKLELCDMHDLTAVGNLDSLLRAFIQDIEPLKDSLADELSVKRIDYIADASGRNKIRIQQFATIGYSYLVNQGTVAALKLEQDTVNILLKANGGPNHLFNSKTPGFHYFRISFFVNNLANLAAYMDGRLQNSIRDLQKNVDNKWVKANDGMLHVKKAPGISTNMWRGQASGNDYLNIRLTSDIQNYKNYFVPSLSLSAIIVCNRNFIKREFSFTGESHFTFAKNDQGKLQTFRNSFLTLGYYQVNKAKERSAFGFDPSFSLGYLIRQRGDVYEKNTFRLGFGRASIFGDRIKIEPVIYFNNFFKGITPGVRISL